MLKKKIIASALAGVMALSMAGTALAASTVTGNEVVLEGEYNPPTVSVLIGPTANNSVYINPYGTPISVLNSTDENYYDLNGQIVSTPLYIANMGTTRLQVGAQASIEVSDGIELATKPVAANATDKQANIILEVATFTEKAASGSSGTSGNDQTIQDLATEFKKGTTEAKDASLVAAAKAENWKGAKQLTFGEEPVTSTEMGILAGNAAVADSVTDMTEIDFAEGAIGLFRLTGTCTTFPETPWTSDDTFTATIVFSFSAVPATA